MSTGTYSTTVRDGPRAAISSAQDIFAFGILMHEVDVFRKSLLALSLSSPFWTLQVVSGKLAFRGQTSADVQDNVRSGQRLQFGPDVPAEYVELATR